MIEDNNKIVRLLYIAKSNFIIINIRNLKIFRGILKSSHQNIIINFVKMFYIFQRIILITKLIIYFIYFL